jgi:hypothetical protein
MVGGELELVEQDNRRIMVAVLVVSVLVGVGLSQFGVEIMSII